MRICPKCGHMLNEKDNICLGCGTQISQMMGNNNFNSNPMQQGFGAQGPMPNQQMPGQRPMRQPMMNQPMMNQPMMNQPMQPAPQRKGSRFNFKQNFDEEYETEEKSFLQKYGIIIVTLIVLVEVTLESFVAL